jgi:hypothetical protein
MRPALAVVLAAVLGLGACDQTSLGISSTPGLTAGNDGGGTPEADAAPGSGHDANFPGPERALRDAGPEPDVNDVVDVGRTDEPTQDAPGDTSPDSAPPRESAPPDVAPDLDRTCSAAVNEWVGCVAGCGACDTVLAPFDLYFQHHPRCQHGGTSCTGAYTSCSVDCPRPTEEDASCLPVPQGSWTGCRDNGCVVDSGAVAAYPGYFRAHPFCLPGSGSGPPTGCSLLCPPPNESDRKVQEGAGWQGCRGYGTWACVELLGRYLSYFKNHPFCVANTTCSGEFFPCSDVCPAPTEADR